jgi:signal transduction histidine kinase
MFVILRRTILILTLLVLQLFTANAANNQVEYIDLKIKELAAIPKSQLIDSVERIIFCLNQFDYALRKEKFQEIINTLPDYAIDAKLETYHYLAEFSLDDRFSALDNALKFALENGREGYYFDYYLAKASWFYLDQQYDSSLVCALRARQLLPKDNPNAEVKMLHLLGDLFYGIQLYDQSEAYYRKAKTRIFKPKCCEAWRGRIIDNNLGLIEMNQGKYEFAYKSFSDAKEQITNPPANFQDSLSYCYYNRKLAVCLYHLNGDANQAIALLGFSYRFSKKYSLVEHLFPTEETLVRFFIKTNHPDSVRKYYNEFCSDFPLKKQLPEQQAMHVLLSAGVNEFFNRDHEALMFYKQYKQINDSLNLHVKSASVITMLTEQDYGNLANSYQHVQKQRTSLIIFVAIILSLILVIVFYFLRGVRLNKKLAALNQTKDKLFSIISHDLRSPFNALLGFSELLNDAIEEKNYKIANQYNAIIQAKSNELYHLTDNLLHWSRTQQGGITFYPDEVLIKTVFDKVLTLSELQAKNKSIEIVVDQSTDMVCYVDQNVLVTVITNLISNAIKFSNVGSAITIRAKYNALNTEISIIDQGVGMSNEKINALFNLATNQSTQGTNDETGTGLGLLICKEFVEKSNGTIRVDSQIGQGSIFTIALPTHITAGR